MEFNKEKIMQSRVYVSCKTHEQAKQLLAWGHSIGRKWSAGQSFLDIDYYRIGISYSIYEGLQGDSEPFASQTMYTFEEVVINTAKYNVIKIITGKNILSHNPCSSEFDKFVKQYGFYHEPVWSSEIEEKFEKEDGWIEFLFDKGFIEKKVSEDQIKIDRYKKERDKLNEKISKLEEIINGEKLYYLRDGSWCVDVTDTGTRLYNMGGKDDKYKVVRKINIINRVGDNWTNGYEKFEYYDIQLKNIKTGQEILTWFSLLTEI